MIERAGKLREERFIIKVVEMHYKQGLSQQEIGKKLNVSRTDIENNYKLVTIIESSGNKVISEVTGTSSLKKILPLFENHL